MSQGSNEQSNCKTIEEAWQDLLECIEKFGDEELSENQLAWMHRSFFAGAQAANYILFRGASTHDSVQEQVAAVLLQSPPPHYPENN